MKETTILAAMTALVLGGVCTRTTARAGGEKLDLSAIESCRAGRCQPLERGYCKSIEDGYCNDTVIVYDLKSTEQNPVLFVNCAAGSVMVIQIPASEKLKGKPVVGNTGLFETLVEGQPPQVMVWTRVPKGAKQEDIQDTKTNLQIDLESGLSVLVMLRVSFFDSAVQRIVLRYPERERQLDEQKRLEDRIRKKVELEFKQMQANLDAEAHRQALALMARGVMSRAECTGLHERAMRDLLMLRAEQICQIGDYVYIKFELHNRARDLFMLSAVEVISVEDGKPAAPRDAVVEWAAGSKPQLRFDQKARGVAMFPVTEQTAAAEYGLRVTESAGKKRTVLLEGLEF